jgi:hypothetical protein
MTGMERLRSRKKEMVLLPVAVKLSHAAAGMETLWRGLGQELLEASASASARVMVWLA